MKEALKSIARRATKDIHKGYDIQARIEMAIEAALAKQEQGEPWGACVSGRVFVGALPEHVRKLSEDEGLPIQWLYTTPPQRKPLTDEQKLTIAHYAANLDWVGKYLASVEFVVEQCEAAHGIAPQGRAK